MYSIQDITSRLLTEVSYLILINFINVRICPRQETREAIVQSNECTLRIFIDCIVLGLITLKRLSQQVHYLLLLLLLLMMRYCVHNSVTL